VKGKVTHCMGRSENRRPPQITAERTADHCWTNHRPPQDSTGRTAEHTAGRGK